MSLESSQLQQPADLGSEASFGQENVLRDLPYEANDIQSYLRSLKEKQMEQIDRVFKSHQSKMEESDRELSQSLREIQLAQATKKKQDEEIQAEELKNKLEEEEYRKKLNVKPQTVEEIREHLKLQMEYQQKVAQSSSMSAASLAAKKRLQQSSQATKSAAPSGHTSSQKKKGTLWYYQNREKAEYEYALREFLKEKERRRTAKPPAPPKVFKPIIIKPEERKKYNSVGEVDIEPATPCSDDLSSYAFETGNDLIESFKHVFENVSVNSQPGTRRRRYRVRDFKDDELLLIAYFFNKIPDHEIEGDDPELNFIKKEQFESALLGTREILLLYNIRPEDLSGELTRLNTSRGGYINQKEAGEFLLTDRPSLGLEHFENVQKVRNQQLQKTTIPVCTLTEEQLSIIRDIFLETDTFGELKVSLRQIIHRIKNDSRTSEWIEKPVAIVKKVERTILMEDLFSEWEQWLSLGKELERKQKDFIDWNTFRDMIMNYKRKDIPSRDKIFATQRLLGRYDFGDTIEIPKEALAIIKVTTELLPKYAQYYINSFDFIESVRNHKQYPVYMGKFVRERKYLDLPIETIDDVLKRIEQECDAYHTQDEILDFFSRKGRPRYLARRITQEKNKVLLRKEQGDSSDEEDSAKLRRELLELRKRRKVAKISGKSEEDAQKQIEKNAFMNNKNFGAQFKTADDEYTITVPKPFQFDEREKSRPITIRQRRLKETLKEKSDEEDKQVSYATAFRANKIPKHIKNRQLWSQIMAKNDQRREQVKKESKSMTVANENPFSFYYRDIEKLNQRLNAAPQVYKFDLFKAKHAPWFCRVRLYDRLRERQARKTQMNVAKRVQELLKSSRLPETVRTMLEKIKTRDQELEQKRLERLKEYSFQPPRAKPVPNFKELQAQFEESMQEKKGEFTSTVPTPFHFQEARKVPKREFMDRENLITKQAKETTNRANREKQLRKILKMKVKRQPPSTLKFEALVQKRRFEQEQKEEQERIEEERKNDKNLRRQKFAEFVNGCIQNVNQSDFQNQLNAHKMRERENRLMEKMQWEEQFDQKMITMMKNVIKRPLLVQQVSQKNFSSERAQHYRQMMGEDGPIQEDVDGEEDDIYVPNFDQMNEQQLREYLNPETVDPQTLEARKYFYYQYVQRSNQMPNINEMENEDDDGEHQEGQDQDQEGYDEGEGQQQHIDGQDEQIQEEDQDHEQHENMDIYEHHNNEEDHQGEEPEEEEEDFQNNQEFIEQQKQVQQIQQQQQQQDDEEDGHPQNSFAQRQLQEGDSKNSPQSNSKPQNKSKAEDQYQEAYHNEGEVDDDEDDEMYEYLDEYGHPIPPHLVKQYKQQMREMGAIEGQEFDGYDEEDFDDEDEDDDNEDIEYVDELGNVIPKELIIEYKNERKLQREQHRKQKEEQEKQRTQLTDQQKQAAAATASSGNAPKPKQEERKENIEQEHEYEVDEEKNPIEYQDEGDANDDYEYEDQHYEKPIDPKVEKYLQQPSQPPPSNPQQKEQEVKSHSSSVSAKAQADSLKQDSKKDASGVQKQDKPNEHSKQEEYDEDFDEEVAYDQYNQRIPTEELRKYREMAARGEIDMEEYEGQDEDEDGEELNEEEQIELYTQQNIQELKAQGKDVDEDEVRKYITHQFMIQQQKQIEIDHQIEEMAPEELAQFVDKSGNPLSKDQIKYILMQQDDDYYDDEEEGYDQEEGDEEEYEQQAAPGKKKEANNSF